MEENFNKLRNRILTSLSKTDLNEIKLILSSLKENTLTSGVGGSSVVSLFLSKVLAEKNNIICENVTARDMLYKNLENYQNVIACSYSGNNYGVVTSFDNQLRHYLFSKNTKDDVINIRYNVKDSEESFISLGATLIPMSIALVYYLDNDLSVIEEILKLSPNYSPKENEVYEILSGYDTSTAEKFLESTLVESGTGIPIVHDKYEYCHGRTTLGYQNNHNLILFDTGNELDELYKSILQSHYLDIITLSKKYDDPIVNDYYFTYLSMYLCKSIAKQKKKDLSIVNYSPLVKKIYYYKGEM